MPPARLDPDDVRQAFVSGSRQIGSHFVKIYQYSPDFPLPMFHDVLSCFLPAAKDKYVAVWLVKEEKRFVIKGECYYVIIKTSDRQVAFPQNCRQLEKTCLPSAHIDFSVYSGGISLNYLESFSRGRGDGGRMITALYNLAQRLRLKKICFYVKMSNMPAKGFYFYTDFGAPQDDSGCFWKVNVEL